jgi:hypothetical protein
LERGQHQIELGLQLRDSSELDLQLVFGVSKALVNRRERFYGEAVANRASCGW